ncbi:CD99 antigen [Pteronotus mesoamericanus]|uniref:CD99 antigen n=1 Tax=Pteronotus mesoamericanus TaxID=1884717 RepID=UPI0023ED4697|nr:CD99 antigen [Pteronotus parnellii mesoamericanus]
MARRALVALLLFGLLHTLVSAQDDFSLLDALEEPDKKPTATPKKPTSGDDFNLEDALGGGGHNDPAPPGPPKPKPNPYPNQPGSSGGISDADLFDHTSGGGRVGYLLCLFARGSAVAPLPCRMPTGSKGSAHGPVLRKDAAQWEIPRHLLPSPFLCVFYHYFTLLMGCFT